MAKFTVGQRVLFTSPPHNLDAWFHAASMGNGDVVMHLNARDENGKVKSITGEIAAIIPQGDGSLMYDFYPDGWIVPASGWPRGFQAQESWLQALEDDTLVLPGTITDKTGHKKE